MEHGRGDRDDARCRNEAYITGNTANGNIEAVRTNEDGTNAASRMGSESDIRIVYVHSAHMVVDKEKWKRDWYEGRPMTCKCVNCTIGLICWSVEQGQRPDRTEMC